ncbi:MAG TPA: HAMP domain-containing sensor histidine kinase [Candidatus Limnocylindrales bacterium]|nr:HAMP domain-containing sensor histidine kinase [Candidatus Limnocylindrales bacterium]
MPGLRGRLAVALVALVAATVVGIGLGTYAFVDARLRESLLADASRQVRFDLSVLVPDRLPANANSAAFEQSGLPEAFRLRADVETIVDFGSDDVWVSGDALIGALGTMPAALSAALAKGDVGYAWTTVAGGRSLVVAGRPATGPTFYFVFPTTSIDAALDQLRLGLVVGGAVAIALALAAARGLARRILVPVRSGSAAAARIAGGDLSARVPETGSDELAAWATEFNRMAAALESTIGRLEDAQRQNRRFVADVAHELRTPLTALVAEASVIEGRLRSLPPDARRAAELLMADVRRLRDLVEDLLELSRFDADAEAATLVSVDLGRSVAAIAAARLPEAGVFLPGEPVVATVDLRRLDRIIGNLLDNARTHAPGAAVDVRVTRADDRASVTVADRGPGVSNAELGHLFERFFKADRSRRTGSTGLGLAIAAENARLLGGSLAARNREGGGLEVSLSLPVTGSLPGGDDPAI